MPKHLTETTFDNVPIKNILLGTEQILINDNGTIKTTNISNVGGSGGGSNSGAFGITIDGGLNNISTGIKGYIILPYNATIVGWDIIAESVGNCNIDILKNITIPTITDSIAGTEHVELISQQLNSNNTITSWQTNLNINDIVAFNVINATVKRVTITIKVIKT